MVSHDPVQTVLIIAMVITLVVVLVVELKILRTRRIRKAGEGDLPDRAHNELLTTKAVSESLAHGGVRSEPAEEAIREAEAALRLRNYRVTMELAEKARGLLRTAKLRHERHGDITKVDEIAAKEAPPEDVTVKEKLTKELPPNYMPAKFSVTIAQEEIDAAKAGGLDTSAAEGHIAEAQTAFEAEDYDGAFRHAVRARRAVETASPPDVEEAKEGGTPKRPREPGRTCPSCAAPVTEDDAFCRKCGTKMPAVKSCPSCDSAVADDDAFCRKCGTEVAKP